jgi:hypothetical protein
VVGTIPSRAPLVKDDAVWFSNWDRTVTVPSGQG